MIEKKIIEIKKLNWFYGRERVLDEINLTFCQNGFYGIIGPNGSGKTTLLKNISGNLIPPPKTIFLKNKDINQFSGKELARNISFVAQNTDLVFEFSVMDMVLMGRNPYLKRLQLEKDNDLEIAQKAMEMTNTWHLRGKNIGQISGGERQRVIIARALAQQSRIMLLDEPVSHLDIHHQIEIMQILKMLINEKKVTVILSLHDLNLAAQYCEELVLMDKGKIFKQGLPAQIMNEENIRHVYGIQASIMKNPLTGKSYLIPHY